MPRQNTPHSVGCCCGTQLMNTAQLASCRRLVVLMSTPNGKIVVLGVGSATNKIVSYKLWDEKIYKDAQMEH